MLRSNSLQISWIKNANSILPRRIQSVSLPLINRILSVSSPQSRRIQNARLFHKSKTARPRPVLSLTVHLARPPFPKIPSKQCRSTFTAKSFHHQHRLTSSQKAQKLKPPPRLTHNLPWLSLKWLTRTCRLVSIKCPKDPKSLEVKAWANTARPSRRWITLLESKQRQLNQRNQKVMVHRSKWQSQNVTRD